MTREEAIKILKEDGCGYCTWQSINPYECENEECKVKEALNMAIQSLSQVTKVRKLILQAERSGVHLDYGAYKFMNALEKVVGEKQIGEFEQEPTSPCDLCRYNPPSSTDGKPCTMCPATAKGGE